jgi:menaquinone-dependent protoporphyrinogen oxidase
MTPTRILVLYAGRHGHTRAIAERIAEDLRAEGHEVELGDARLPGAPPPEDYDMVILGSSVVLGHHAVDVRNYITSHHEALAEMPTAFFSVSMAAARTGATSDPSGYLAALFEDVAWVPTVYAAFAGGLAYRRYGRLLRVVMRHIARAAGHTTDTSRDHVFTDWHRVHAFAGEIAAQLRSSPPLAGDHLRS